jgi:lysophospholipase L1-like esterase
MHIACFGDSLTEGSPGVGFFKLLEADFPKHTFYNFGKIGDTVISLYERLGQTSLGNYDISILWIGGNDVFSKIIYKSSILGQVPDQKPSATLEEFIEYYDKLLGLLRPYSRHIITVSPLTIGEDFGNEWNKQLEQLALTIKDHVSSYSDISYIDLRSKFAQALQGNKSSDYYAQSAVGLLRDISKLKTPEMVDQKSAERGLILTLDGVHLNSKGARLVKEAFAEGMRQV